MSRYAHALHATLSSHLIRSRLIARVSPCGPFLLLSLSLFLFRCLLIWCHISFSPFLILVPSHFPSFLTRRLHTLFSFFRSLFLSLAFARRPFNPISSARGYPGLPVAPFSFRSSAPSFISNSANASIFPSGLLLSYTFSTVRKMLNMTESNIESTFFI